MDSAGNDFEHSVPDAGRSVAVIQVGSRGHDGRNTAPPAALAAARHATDSLSDPQRSWTPDAEAVMVVSYLPSESTENVTSAINHLLTICRCTQGAQSAACMEHPR